MICQICSKNPATIHVTEIHHVHFQAQQTDLSTPGAEAAKAEQTIEQKHLCEPCAQGMQLPHAPITAGTGKTAMNIWKLLQNSARKARQEGSLACPDCGMTLAEFRAKGRLGCPRDYGVFKEHLLPLLRRVHNAEGHKGRLPGVDETERQRRNLLGDLRVQLERAIAEEAYENAARLRDEIQELEG